jgi:REP element-mobilizing transposase RayT
MVAMPSSYNPDIHHRRSIRLRHYDYRQAGAYYVTFCTYNRLSIFGKIVDGKMVLNKIGQIAATEWERSPEIRREIELDAWVIMPNHMHAIVLITESNIENTPPNKSNISPNTAIRGLGSIKRSLSSLVQGFKSSATLKINAHRKTPRLPVWQRNLWEEVIKSEERLNEIRDYIINNPRRWSEDDYNPAVNP